MSFPTHPRGKCMHAECSHGLAGCAAFVVFVNDTLREYALSPDELCSACMHAWFSHEIGQSEVQDRPALYRRGGCPAFQCGGFVAPQDPANTNWDLPCGCGAPLKAHTILPGGTVPSTVSHSLQALPPQLTMAHPPLPPPAPLIPLSSSSSDPRALAAAPPIQAYSGLRRSEPGSANDRRMASAERSRPPQRANVSRPRSSTSHTIPPPPLPPSVPTGMLPSAPVDATVSGSSVSTSDDSPNQVYTVILIPYQPPTMQPRRGAYPKAEFAWTPEQFDNVVSQAVHYKLVFTVSLPRHGPVWEPFGTQVRDYCRDHHIVFGGYDTSSVAQTPTALPFVLLRTSNKRKPPGTKLHSPFDDLNCHTFTVATLMDKSLTTPSYPRPEPEFAAHPLLRIAPRRADLNADMLRSNLWTSEVPGMIDYLDIQASHRPHPCFASRVMCVVDPAIHPRCRADCPSDSPEAVSPSPAGPSHPHIPDSPGHGLSHILHSPPTALADLPSVPHPRSSSPGASSAGLGQNVSLPSSSSLTCMPPAPLTLSPSLSALELPAVSLGDDLDSSSSSTVPSPSVLWQGLPIRPPSSHPQPFHGTPLFLNDLSPAMEPGSLASPSSAIDSSDRRPSSVPTVQYGRRGRARGRGRGARTSARMSTGGRPPASQRRSSRRPSAPSEDHSLSVLESTVSAGLSLLGGSTAPSPEVPDTLMDNGYSTPSVAPQLSLNRRRPRSRSPDGSAVTSGVAADHALASPSVSCPPATNRRRTHSPSPAVLPAPQPPAPVPLRQVSEGAVKAWRSRLLRAIVHEPDFSDPVPHIQAPDVDTAADILIFLVRWLITHRFAPVGDATKAVFDGHFLAAFPHPQAQCSITTLSRLLRHGESLDLHVGEALGSSPIRAVFRASLQKLVADERYWQPHGRFTHIRPGPAGFPEREEHYTVCGFFALWHMTALRLGPHPISPFLLRYAIEGRDRALSFDQPFLRLLDSELYDKLLPWAHYAWGTPLPANPLHPLNSLVFSASLDLKALSDPPRAPELEWLERHLVACAIFGGTELATSDDMLASFIRGMHLVLPVGRTLDEIFEGQSRNYLAVMCSVRLSSVAVLLSNISFRSALNVVALEAESSQSEVMSDQMWDALYEDSFQQKLSRYLKGTGHPDHPDVRQVVGEVVFERDRHDPLLRARLFLQMMSGSDLLPPGDDWQLKIFFRHTGRRDPDVLGGLGSTIERPIEVHSCFYDCTVTINEGVRTLLCEEDPGILFEVWLHGFVMDPHDYNAV